MFACACSLRSTQCAALIAMAAVAGLARVEMKTLERPATGTAAKPAPAPMASYISLFFSRLANFNPSLKPAPQRNVLEVAPAVIIGEGQAFDQGHIQACYIIAPPLLPTLSQARPPAESEVLTGLSAAKPELPWAMGPPPR